MKNLETGENLLSRAILHLSASNEIPIWENIISGDPRRRASINKTGSEPDKLFIGSNDIFPWVYNIRNGLSFSVQRFIRIEILKIFIENNVENVIIYWKLCRECGSVSSNTISYHSLLSLTEMFCNITTLHNLKLRNRNIKNLWINIISASAMNITKESNSLNWKIFKQMLKRR